LIAAAPAAADHSRSTVPSGLTSTVTGTHFALHYNPASSTQAYAEAGLADFEESYSRLVNGGGGTPNAGLNVPHTYADGKIDVYLAAPTDQPGFSGGVVRADTGHGPAESYAFMTPDLSRAEFRFRAAHELTHVIQNGYFTGIVGVLTESTANWGAELALPDVDPGDSNFSHPWTPFDCSFGSWEGVSCGNGYWQWLFWRHASEDFGNDFVHGLLTRFAAVCGVSGCTDSQVRTVIDDEIDAQDPAADRPAGEALRARYGEYAEDILDPTRWTTTAVGTIHSALGPPARTTIAQFGGGTSTQTSTSGTAVVDHLGTRYLRIRNQGGFLPSGPSTRLGVELTRPTPLLVDTPILARAPGSNALSELLSLGGTTSGASLGIDPAGVSEIWIPLVNDSSAVNDKVFGYTVEWEVGTPTPPANDEPAGAQTVTLGNQAEVNNVYAGGRGDTEAPNCPGASDASRGTWYRFTAPGDGTYSFTTTGSDFRAVVSIYKGASFQGCSSGVPSGSFNVNDVAEGDVLDVYVGRHRDATVTSGTTARLLVSGPGAPPAPPANDLRANPTVVSLGMPAETDIAGATGTGATEFPDCPPLASARRGVWYRFTTPNTGTYTYDAKGSNFPAGVALYESTGAFGGCSASGEFAVVQQRGKTYDVYVARRSGTNTQARLVVTGPAAPADPPPSDGGEGGGTGAGDTGGGTAGTTLTPAGSGQAPTFAPAPTAQVGPTANQTPSPACQRARNAYASANKAYSKAKKAAKKAKSKSAKKRANAKVKKLKKKLSAAKRARDKACAA
jgi:hypothetical protein